MKQYGKIILPKGYTSYISTIGPLACDRYALTMTYAAWKLGVVDTLATTSNVFCRSLINNGDTYKDSVTGEERNVKVPYLINAGLGLVAEWYSGWRWTDRELGYLAQQRIDNKKGPLKRLFPNEFLDWLSRQRLTLDIRAVDEGQLIFPHEPALQLSGSWWQQMAVEATTLNLIASSTNLATVASQVRLAAQREAFRSEKKLIEASAKEYASLAEMALRRSSSVAALQSARAAAIAGWENTSNEYAGMCYGIPVMGTFSHAWVMLHDTEEEAFENWARVFPNSTVFLVDTYNTLEGVKTAIRVCKKHKLRLMGIRLDSGNLAYLSRETKILLKEAGYKDAKILATDGISTKSAASLFGHVSVNDNEASAVTGFGIGSEVAVNRDNPLLDFVMKLAARYCGKEEGRVRELIKLSENDKKTTYPGLIDVVRYIDKKGLWAGDTIIPADLNTGTKFLEQEIYSEHVTTGAVKCFPKGTPFIRLLQPWMKRGVFIQTPYAQQDASAVLATSRTTCASALSKLDKAHLCISPNMPHSYGVGVAKELAEKQKYYRQKTFKN